MLLHLICASVGLTASCLLQAKKKMGAVGNGAGKVGKLQTPHRHCDMFTVFCMALCVWVPLEMITRGQTCDKNNNNIKEIFVKNGEKSGENYKKKGMKAGGGSLRKRGCQRN